MPLYKFLGPEPDIVIGNRRLRFTRPSGLNDPFELKPYVESIASEEEIAEKFFSQFNIGAAFDKAYGNLSPAQKRIMPKVAFLKFAKDQIAKNKFDLEASIQKQLDTFFEMLPAMSAHIRSELHKKFEQIGILSLTTDPVSMHMWTHYAKAHTGFAVEFDETNKFFNQRVGDKDEFRHLRKVEYFDKLPTYASFSEMDGHKIFCTKGSDYTLEKEWRMLLPLCEPSPTSSILDELVEFPEDAITAVIFGLKADDDFIESVSQHLYSNQKYAHVKRRKIVMNHKEGVLQITDI